MKTALVLQIEAAGSRYFSYFIFIYLYTTIALDLPKVIPSKMK